MSWPTVLALELAVPLLLFSAVFGWVANIMGIRDKVGKRMSDLKATMREIFNEHGLGGKVVEKYAFAVGSETTF